MRKTRGQSVAEYAILIGVVIAAIIGMQLYVKRGLQGKTRAVMDAFADKERGGITSKLQYEPYYTAAGDITTTTKNNQQPTMTAGAKIAITGINDSSDRAGKQTQGADQGADSDWK